MGGNRITALEEAKLPKTDKVGINALELGTRQSIRLVKNRGKPTLEVRQEMTFQPNRLQYL